MPKEDNRRPVHLLTGFLGAGKTTFLNGVLGLDAFARTAVIINEFGEVSLDHLLVTRSDDSILELSNGCLCCTIRGQLIDTILDLAERDFDRLVIETTGLADPVPVLQAILGHPEVSERFRLSSVLTLVDSLTGLDQLARQPEAERQVAMASEILVTKLDAMPELKQEARFKKIVERCRQLNPDARITRRDQMQDPSTLLLSDGQQGGWEGMATDRHAADHSPDPSHEHSHAHDEHDHHHHDANHHSNRIKAVTLQHDQPINRERLSQFCELMASAHADHLLRLKGLACVADDPDHPLVIQGVGSVINASEKLDRWPGESRTSLVAILDGMDPQFVLALFNGFLDVPHPDTPDRAALTDNPLAVPGHAFNK